GGSSHGGEKRRVDEGREKRVAKLLRLFEELGETAKGLLEDAALLSRADHVDVEAREGTRVMLGERFAERGAAAYALPHVLDDGAKARVRDESLLHPAAAIEPHPA